VRSVRVPSLVGFFHAAQIHTTLRFDHAGDGGVLGDIQQGCYVPRGIILVTVDGLGLPGAGFFFIAGTHGHATNVCPGLKDGITTPCLVDADDLPSIIPIGKRDFGFDPH